MQYAPRTRVRAGVSVVEMALVLPILLMLSFGMIDYGYFFYLKNTIQGAAQTGVRAAIVPGATQTNATDAVASVMTLSGFKTTNYTVTTVPADVSTATSGSMVSITVSCNWGTIGYHDLPVALGGISNTKNVTGAAAMRKE
jgi:Flp pilus assembly protein TadG